MPITGNALAAASDLAVEVRVIDVRPSRANTPDGAFPAIDTDAGPEQLNRLFPLTDVEVEVISLLGRSRNPEAILVTPGTRLVVTLHGGTISTILTPDEAKALGVLVPVGEPAPPSDDGRDIGTTQLEPAEVFPEGPTPFTDSLAIDESLSEGETVVMFLRYTTKEILGGGELPVLAPTHPAGVYHRDSDGTWVSDFLRDSPEDLAGLIGTQG